MIFCDLCQLSFSSPHAFQTHCDGDRHQQLLAEKAKREECAQRSVYVSKIPRGMQTSAIGNYLHKFGPIKELIVDERRGAFAIVEFVNRESAAKVLANQQHFIDGSAVVVKPRLLKKENVYNRHLVHFKQPFMSECSYESIIDALLAAPNVAHQMVTLKGLLELSEGEIKERQEICQYMNKCLSEYFLDGEVLLFGSSVNGLGNHGCDVDLLLALKKEAEDTKKITFADETDEEVLRTINEVINLRERKITIEELQKLNVTEMLNILKNIVKKVGKKCNNIFIIPSKRCPLIRFQIKFRHNLTCDLSVKNRLSIYNSKLIKLYMRLDPNVLPLTYTIRYWAKRRNLSTDTTNRVTSYATTMLVIFFLQNVHPPVLPTVEELRSFTTERRIQGGWECSFCEDVSLIVKSENTSYMVDLLKEFFNFYSQFDFINYVICPSSGKSVSKQEITATIPEFTLKSISVQDPFDFSHNITANLDIHLTAKVFEAFAEAKKLLDDKNVWNRNIDNSPWGLIRLFDNIHKNDLAEDNWDDAPVQQSNAAKEDEAEEELPEHLVGKPKIEFLVLNPCDVEEIRGVHPSTSDGPKDDEEWFQKVCETVCGVFATGLKFSCSTEEDWLAAMEEEKAEMAAATTSSGKRTRAFVNEPDSKKVKRSEQDKNGDRPEEEREQQEEEDDEDEQLDRFVCHVYRRTWIGRRKARSKMPMMDESLPVLEVEERISDFIAEGVPVPAEPLYSFLCQVQQTKLLEVKVTLTALTDSSELVGNAFTFLQSYVPKIIKQMHVAKEIKV